MGPGIRRALVLGTPVAACAAIFFWLLHASPAPVRAVRAAVRPLRVPILSSGTLEPPREGELRAPCSSIVASLAAEDGERVRSGQPLVRLDSLAVVTSELEAREALARLRAERLATQAELAGIDAELAANRRIVEGDSRLLEKGAIARATLDKDSTVLQGYEARERAIAARLAELGAEERPETSLGAAAQRESDLLRRVQGLTLRAPSDGTVYGLPRRTGEAVAEGQVVAGVSDPDHPKVRVRVDQPDLPGISPGVRMIVTFDGLPDQRFEGLVSRVEKGVREAAGRTVGEVLGEISDHDHRLPLNASVNVEIVVAESPSALVVPRAAVFREGSTRFVYVVESGKARRRDVSVGLIGTNEIEVNTGVAPGDIVILPGTVPLKDGLPVLPKA